MSQQSRALTAATYTKTNRPRRAIPTDRDLIGFELLGRYGYARLDALHAFMGGSLDNLGTHWKHRIHPVTTARTVSPAVLLAHNGCRTGSVSMAFSASVSERPR